MAGYYPPSHSGYYPPSHSGYQPEVPTAYPVGMDMNIVAIFAAVDDDRNGFIDDLELQQALEGDNGRRFSLRTVHLLMRHFTAGDSFQIGLSEFISLYQSLQNWRENFERFDRDRSGRIDASELDAALRSLKFPVSPEIVKILFSKFSEPGRVQALPYDHFIDCCLIIKGLTEKFKENDYRKCGTASFTYDQFMLAVLPYLFV